ncbi:MAG: MotA/TolQ/ExbB proton channel family protein [Bacteroidota bacterium]
MNLLTTEIITASPLTALGHKETVSLWNLLLKGGWVMLPILLLSILAVYAILERLIALHRTINVPRYWTESLNAQLIAGNTQGAQALCEGKNYAIARVIQAGIEKLQKPSKIIQAAVENAAQHEVHRLEKNLALLGTIASAAPMLGFLGTVLGMIQAFMAMAQQTQQISPKLLSGGIYEAMVTTAAGLVVGIIANLSYNYFLTRIQRATHRLEQEANQFIEIVENYPTH